MQYVISNIFGVKECNGNGLLIRPDELLIRPDELIIRSDGLIIRPDELLNCHTMSLRGFRNFSDWTVRMICFVYEVK